MNSDSLARMDRRIAIKWMLTAMASVAALELSPFSGATEVTPEAKGYGGDPDLLKNYQPGELWPLTLTEAQRRVAAALCDVILPADAQSPSASALHVPEFIDEWISAPYPDQRRDRTVIIEGLTWIDREAQHRFSSGFADLKGPQQAMICDDICFLPKAKPEFTVAAQFFKKFRDLTASGFYTTPAGMKDVGYIGNVPLAEFPAPPAATLKKLGLTLN